MLSSVFNRRKVQQKLNNLTNNSRRVASPPSPASFESPEIVEINDKSITSSHAHQASEPGPPVRVVSPQVELNLRRSDSLSDWFPADLLRGEPMAPPERNESLAGARGRSASNAHEPFNIHSDEVIIIEAEHNIETADESLQSSSESANSQESNSSPPRKAAPTPIKIPDNPTSLKVTLRRSSSASGLHANSGDASGTPSRPASTYSDVSSSAISGTTIARALVANSFIVSNGSRQSNFRGVTRQDSATLPKGEHPFLTSPYWRDKRISNGEIVSGDGLGSAIPPVPLMPVSAESVLDSGGRSQRNATSVAEARRQSEERLNGLVSPVTIPASCKPSRSGSLTRQQKEQLFASRVSTISEGSSQASPLAPTMSTAATSPITMRSRLSANSASTGKHRSSGGSSERYPASSATSLQQDDTASSRYKHHSGSSSHSGFHGSSSRERSMLEPPVMTGVAHSRSDSQSSSFCPFPNPHPSPDSMTATTSSAYSPQSLDTGSVGTTEASSPASSSIDMMSPSSFSVYRSYSDRGSSRVAPNRPVIQVPQLGERPHSVPVSASPLSSTRGSSEQHHKSPRPSAVPVSARLPGDSPMDSPDWLDVMVSKSALIMNPSASTRRSGSHLPPITVPYGDDDVLSPDNSFSAESPSLESAARQTFPETPYAFSPLVSAGFAPPALPNHPKNSPRTASLHGRGIVRSRGITPRQQLFRSATVGKALRTPEIAEAANPEPPVSPPSSLLSAIEESTPSTPVSHLDAFEKAQLTPETGSLASPELTSIASPDSKYTVDPPSQSETSFSSLSPHREASPPPPASSVLRIVSSPEPGHSQRPSSHSLVPEPSTAVSSVTAERSLTPSTPPKSFVTDLPPPFLRPSQVNDVMSFLASSPRNSAEQNTQPLPAYYAEPVPIQPPEPSPPPYRDGSFDSAFAQKRAPRSRPNPPSGPRRPSAPKILLASARARNGSISSLHSITGRQAGPSFSASAPRFQTTPIRLRGLTLEQAQWTLSSGQLQSIVSKSIKQWAADPASLRLLPPHTLRSELANDRQALEGQSAELKTSYKLAVRKRRALLSSLSNVMDAGDFQDQAALIRMTEELKEISDNMDRISEDLYSATDQLAQLTHLEDVHNSSALTMALRKINTSFIKHLQDNAALRQRISELEAERDEGWAHAQDVAAELEAKDPSSKRTSRVVVARKTSIRASKAGLRSPSRHRSQRSSSQSSACNSGTFSPAVRSAYDEIPPVPPIPGRVSLGIVTNDLPIRSPGLMSEGTPTSEARAMADAQRELCEMLGITVDKLQIGSPTKRRVSTSDVGGPGSSSTTHTRRNSDAATPARTKDEQRAAVLASIGMIYHEI